MTQLAPIILFVYNRPFHTEQVINALLANDLAKYSDLFIYADGPRDDASDEQIEKIKKVRDYIKTISGFKSVKIIEQVVNKGLDPSEIDAITEIISKFGKVIVLEDDVVVHHYFLRFLNEALDVFQYNKKVFSIGSYTQDADYMKSIKTDLYASYRSATYGWGTWHDRWEKCSWKKDYLLSKKMTFHPSFIDKIHYNRAGGDMYDNLMAYINGDTDAWDARWQYCMYENDAYCIYPTKSLSYNIGFDGTGVHCGKIDSFENSNLKSNMYNATVYKFNFKINLRVSLSLQYKMCKYHSYDKTPIIKKIKWWLKELLIRKIRKS